MWLYPLNWLDHFKHLKYLAGPLGSGQLAVRLVYQRNYVNQMEHFTQLDHFSQMDFFNKLDQFLTSDHSMQLDHFPKFLPLKPIRSFAEVEPFYLARQF